MGKSKKETMLTPESEVGATEESRGEPLSDEVRRVFCDHIHPMLPVLSSSILRETFITNGTNQFLRVLQLAITAAAAPYLVTKERSHAGREKQQDFINGHYNRAVARTVISLTDASLTFDQQDAFFKNTSCLTQLETIQVAIFLSFAARRRFGRPTTSSLEWLHLINTRLKAVRRSEQWHNDSVLPERRQWRRIWWTCFLYERLDAFNAPDDEPSAMFLLDGKDIPPLTLEDMDVEPWCCAIKQDGEPCNTVCCNTLETLRTASVFVQKVELAREVDIAMNPPRDGAANAATAHRDHPALFSSSFWHAYDVEQSFAAWQARTGIIDDVYTASSMTSSAVHYTSLHLLYYRVLIALYTSSALKSDILSSNSRRTQRSYEEQRILAFYRLILEKTHLLIKPGQLKEVHVTYPNIWWYVFTASKVWWREQRHPDHEHVRYLAVSVVKAFEKVMGGSGTLAEHTTAAEMTDLFRFPTPPATPQSADSENPEWNSLLERDVDGTETLSKRTSDDDGDEEVEMEAEDMLRNMESLLYNYKGSLGLG
jgi:hypothetical protein